MVAKIFGRDFAIPQSMLDQVPLIRAVEQIQSALPSLAYNGSEASSGFAGMIFTTDSVELCVRCNIRKDRRSGRQILARGAEKAAAPLSAYIWQANNAFHGVSIRANGSSIVIHGDSAGLTAVLSSMLTNELKNISGLDVPIVVQSEPAPEVTHRRRDRNLSRHPKARRETGRCTAGFTSNHMGPSSSWVLQRDNILIRTDVGVNGAVWDGPARCGEYLRGVAAFHTGPLQNMAEGVKMDGWTAACDGEWRAIVFGGRQQEDLGDGNELWILR
ncbi:hypothetical protein BJ742DRAFT_743308 [Cladochytrium replicatum]|nr:hypothetical protein BJ742DRAFT_743308 [Cladochytrium replicatum]